MLNRRFFQELVITCLRIVRSKTFIERFQIQINFHRTFWCHSAERECVRVPGQTITYDETLDGHRDAVLFGHLKINIEGPLIMKIILTLTSPNLTSLNNYHHC